MGQEPDTVGIQEGRKKKELVLLFLTAGQRSESCNKATNSREDLCELFVLTTFKGGFRSCEICAYADLKRKASAAAFYLVEVST